MRQWLIVSVFCFAGCSGESSDGAGSGADAGSSVNPDAAIAMDAAVEEGGPGDDAAAAQGPEGGSDGSVDNSDGGPLGPDFERVTLLAAGYAHACAQTADGRVTCWGSNGDGQLGRDDSDEPSFGEGLKAVELGGGEVAELALGYEKS